MPSIAIIDIFGVYIIFILIQAYYDKTQAIIQIKCTTAFHADTSCILNYIYINMSIYIYIHKAVQYFAYIHARKLFLVNEVFAICLLEIYWAHDIARILLNYIFQSKKNVKNEVVSTSEKFMVCVG